MNTNASVIKSNDILLNFQQTAALSAIKSFLKSNEQVFILNGAAGTGKTTLIKSLCLFLDENKTRFQLAATTGRAAKVLSARTGFDVKTLHGLLYVFDEVSGQAKEGEDPWQSQTGQLFLQFDLRQSEADHHPDVIIVDEASMISHLHANDGHTARFGSGNLLADLMAFVGKAKLIFVGDACQLPPVADLSLSAALSLSYWQQEGVGAQIFTLTSIVRQQQHNEILETATLFRKRIEQTGTISLMQLPLPKSRNVFSTLGKDAFLDAYFTAVQQHGLTQAIALCHSNAHAHDLNTLMRRRLHGNESLQSGDLLMVVQNSYNTHLVNGDQVIVKEVAPHDNRAGFTFLKIKVESLFSKDVYETLLINELLYSDNPGLTNDEVKRLLIDFDDRMRYLKVKRNSNVYKSKMKEDLYLNALRAKYGYAITVHKAQGGEWDAVFLYLNTSIYSQVYHPKGGRHPDGADKYHRWFYTAITRARERLVINDCPFVEKFAQRHPDENARYWKDLQKAKMAAAARLKQCPSGRISGKVIRLLNQNEQGVNGFIQPDNFSDQVYFILSAKNPLCARIKAGLKLTFEIMPPKNNKGAKATRLQLTTNHKS